MLDIRAHLNDCCACQDEYEALRETKRLVASLAVRAPRAELEALLLGEAARAERQATPGGWLERAMGWLWTGGTVPTTITPLYQRMRPLAATAVLSVAGLWLASVSLDGPRDTVAATSGSIDFEPAPMVSNISPVTTLVAIAPAAPSGLVMTSSGAYAPASYAEAGMVPVNARLVPVSVAPPLPSRSSDGIVWGNASAVSPSNLTILSTMRRLTVGH